MNHKLWLRLTASLAIIGGSFIGGTAANAEEGALGNFYLAPEVAYVLPVDGDVDDTIFIGGRAGFWLAPEWGLELEAGWMEYGIDATEQFQNIKIDSVPIMLNVRYQINCRTTDSQNRWGWYLFAGVGAAINDLEEDDDDLFPGAGDAEIDDSVVWQAGVGVDYMLDGGIAPFLDVRYLMNKADVKGSNVLENVAEDDDVDLSAVMFTLGARF